MAELTNSDSVVSSSELLVSVSPSLKWANEEVLEESVVVSCLGTNKHKPLGELPTSLKSKASKNGEVPSLCPDLLDSFNDEYLEMDGVKFTEDASFFREEILNHGSPVARGGRGGRRAGLGGRGNGRSLFKGQIQASRGGKEAGFLHKGSGFSPNLVGSNLVCKRNDANDANGKKISLSADHATVKEDAANIPLALSGDPKGPTSTIHVCLGQPQAAHPLLEINGGHEGSTSNIQHSLGQPHAFHLPLVMSGEQEGPATHVLNNLDQPHNAFVSAERILPLISSPHVLNGAQHMVSKVPSSSPSPSFPTHLSQPLCGPKAASINPLQKDSNFPPLPLKLGNTLPIGVGPPKSGQTSPHSWANVAGIPNFKNDGLDLSSSSCLG